MPWILLAAAFALGALCVPGAAANTIVSPEAEEFTLAGEETGSGANRLTAFGSRFQCPGTTYAGTVSGGTLTLVPELAACTATALNFPTTVDMNGCAYEIDLGETAETATYEAAAELQCPGTGPVLSMFKFSSEHNEENLKCTLELMPGEAPAAGLQLTDKRDGFVALAGGVEGLTATQHGPTCLSGETEAGGNGLDVDAIFDGHDFDEETVPVEVVDNEPIGVEVADRGPAVGLEVADLVAVKLEVAET